jgi:hypothetical protein
MRRIFMMKKLLGLCVLLATYHVAAQTVVEEFNVKIFAPSPGGMYSEKYALESINKMLEQNMITCYLENNELVVDEKNSTFLGKLVCEGDPDVRVYGLLEQRGPWVWSPIYANMTYTNRTTFETITNDFKVSH